MKYSEWRIPRGGPAIPPGLTGAGYPPLLAAVLARRGIDTPEAADNFTQGGVELLSDPLLMKDMDKAAERVRRAIAARESVAVFGDYDVDGITSVCLLASYLAARGVPCRTYIPDRIEEGYGLNSAAIDSIAAAGVTLIVTVDCGITAADEAAHAAELGLDMVITDHHECAQDVLPEAVAVVDPKRPDCEYPDVGLAGVGVAFKLLCAVDGDVQRILDEYADLIAIGTVADVMPLEGENRYIVRLGLSKLAQTRRPGMSALLTESGAAGKRITATTLGFTLSPRINAAGRLGHAEVAVQLLMTDDAEKAAELAAELCRLNRERQTIEQQIFEQAHSALEKEPPTAPIVLASEDWHQGVIGIAASKLADEYFLPAVMICLDGDTGKGSCRSCGDFNLYSALRACSQYLEGFGGHALAAGLTIRRENVDAFRAALAEYYRQNPASGAQELVCDLCAEDPDILDMAGVAALERMEPFGAGNPKPIICMTDALLERVTPIGAGKHLRLNIKKCGRSFECVYFSMTEGALGVSGGDRIDIAFYPQINDFRSRKSVQLLVTDVRAADMSLLCRRILRPGASQPWGVAAFCPERRDFVRTWRLLEGLGGELTGTVRAVMALAPDDMPAPRFCICLRTMADGGLLRLEESEDDEVAVTALGQGVGRVDLEAVPYLSRIRSFRSR